MFRVRLDWMQCPNERKALEHVPVCLIPLPLFSLSSPGARVNAKDNMWLTPLHRAVASRSEVGLGADPAIVTLIHKIFFYKVGYVEVQV